MHLSMRYCQEEGVSSKRAASDQSSLKSQVDFPMLMGDGQMLPSSVSQGTENEGRVANRTLALSDLDSPNRPLLVL
jgi:hypothetical protein